MKQFCAVLTLTILGGLGSNEAISELSISNLWKARALEAANKIKSLDAKLKRIPESKWNTKVAMKIRCETMVEMAYGVHLAMEETVHKSDKEAEFFHIILNGGEAGLFDIVYVYTLSGELLMTRIDMLPEGWHLLFITSGHTQVLLPNNGCLFEFGLSDPFRAKVLD